MFQKEYSYKKIRSMEKQVKSRLQSKGIYFSLWINQEGNCSLSLWRVARGSKLMFLELIHGLFTT
jgi:muconolactone delta-isomerase